MKRVGLVLSVLAVLISSFTSIFYPSTAHATSLYDNLIKPTSTISLYGTSCNIEVNFAGIVTDFIKNDSLWQSEQTDLVESSLKPNHEGIKNTWDNRTAYQIIQQGTYTQTKSDDYIQLLFTDDPSASWGFGDLYGTPSDPFPIMGLITPTSGYHVAYLSLDTNDTCSNINIPGGGYYPTSGDNSLGLTILFANSNTNYLPSGDYYANGGPVNYPPGYAGPNAPAPPSEKFKIFPTLSISIQNKGVDKNDIIMTMDDDFIDKYHLPNPDYILLTLTKYPSQEIVAAQSFTGPYPKYSDIPKGQYTVHLTVVYTDPNITNVYEFKDSFYNIDVNDTSFSIFYNSKEGKYCSVRGGYEWNCQIPQPQDESTDVVNGNPEDWQPEQCSVTDIGACIRNSLHYLSEYLGLNGPNIHSGTSMFFQYDGAKNLNGLASIVTAPISILTSLQNAQYTCNTLSLPMPFINRNLPLPCMHSYYTTYMGQLYTIWQTVINGIVSYWVIVGMLKIIKDAKDPKKDQIEVLNL